MLALPAENPREALVAAVERVLAALEQPGGGASDAPQGPPGAPVAGPPSVPATAAVEPVAPPPSASAPRGEVGAGVLGEIWDGSFAYGARLVVDYRRAPWSVGAAFGWLTTPEATDAFRANELSGMVFGALEEARTTGLRGSLGVGLSALTVSPEPGIIVHTPTMMALVYADAELARPVRFGHVWLLPAVGARLFPGRREVTVNAARRLVLPPLCPALFIGLGYEI